MYFLLSNDIAHIQTIEREKSTEGLLTIILNQEHLLPLTLSHRPAVPSMVNAGPTDPLHYPLIIIDAPNLLGPRPGERRAPRPGRAAPAAAL